MKISREIEQHWRTGEPYPREGYAGFVVEKWKGSGKISGSSLQLLWENPKTFVKFIAREYAELGWEEGRDYFKSKGYKFSPSITPVIIPQQMERRMVCTTHPDGFAEWILYAEAATYNQPKDWTGEVQVNKSKVDNTWTEIIVSVIHDLNAK